MAAVGDSSKKSPGISDDVVAHATRAIQKILNIDPNQPDESQTTINSNIYDGWVYQSGDPETQVPRWLRSGAPMGFEVDPISVGIFSWVTSTCPEELRRPLEVWGEEFCNYVSLEDSPHGEAVLQKLVDANCVRKVRRLPDAKRILWDPQSRPSWP